MSKVFFIFNKTNIDKRLLFSIIHFFVVEQLPIREYPERASDIINKIPLAEVINTASLKKREELVCVKYH